MLRDYGLSHIGFMVWLVSMFDYRPTTMKDIADKASKRLEALRYHIIALEDYGLLEVDRRHRPHTITVNKKKWLAVSTPKNGG